MPVARYFLFVGGVLLALLLAVDAFAPQQVAVASNTAPTVDKTVVRIRSDQKLPERVVYDTSLPTIVPPTATVQVAAAPAAPAAEATAHARVRDTFAQFVPAEAKEARASGSAQAQGCQGPRESAGARSAAVAIRLLRWTGLEQHLVRCAPRGLSRQLWNFFRKLVVAGQALVFLFLEAAFGDAFRGRCLRLGLRRIDRVVAVQAFLGRVVDVLTGLQLLGWTTAASPSPFYPPRTSSTRPRPAAFPRSWEGRRECSFPEQAQRPDKGSPARG